MKKTFRSIATLVLATCLLVVAMPTALFPASAETITQVFDFNGTDFNATLKGTVMLTQATLITNGSAPAGYTDSVMGGVGGSYVSVAVNFGRPIDLSKVVSIKVRMYVPSTSNEGNSQLRITGVNETTNERYTGKTYANWGGSFNQWCEIDITDAVKSGVYNDATGTLSNFAIGYRDYSGSGRTIYYDSLTVVSDGDFLVQPTQPDPDPVTPEGFDFNGSDFTTPTTTNSYVSDTAYFATSTATAPSGYSGGVYKVINSTYAATWINFNGKIDLSKATSVRVRMYVASYTLETGRTAQFRVFGESDTYETLSFSGPYDQWIEVELLNVLKSSKVVKKADGSVGRFLFSLRTYGPATVYYDSVIVEGNGAFIESAPVQYVDATPTSIIEQHSGHAPNQECWNIYLSTANNPAIPGTPWETKWQNVPVEINGTTYKMNVVRAEVTNGIYIRIEYDTLPKFDSYAEVTVKAGKYESNDDSNGIQIARDFTFYIYNHDAWNAAPPQNIAVDVTFDKLDEPVSLVSGSRWDMYPVPFGPSGMPGTPWKTFWNVTYEVDGVPYTAKMTRAANEQGLYFAISGTIVSPAADGVTIVIKAGTYATAADSQAAPSLNITEDFTFYVIGGKAISNFDFDDPKFSSSITVNVDKGSYIVEEGADSATIDGVAVAPGTAYDLVGTHTLVYAKWDREYTRKVVIYRLGEVGDNQAVNACDVVLLKRYLAGETELSESAMIGADVNVSSEVNGLDMSLLRKERLMIEGLLILSPENGVTAMGPSQQVTELVTNYDPYGLKGNVLQNGTDQFNRAPLILRWTAKGDFTEYKIHVATKADFSDEMVHTTTSKEYTLVNLLPATTYYWKITSDGFATDVRSFKTEDTIRTLTIDGVSNSRDIGGYATGANTRLKYGMVYRTATLDTITDEGLYQMLTVLGIKTELDVRTPGEGTAGGQSPLGTDINYINYSGPYYYNTTSGIIADAYQDALRAEIRAFADPDNYPIVVHCSVGRDRTGTILFLIEGLCGVSKEDLYLEYELSFLARIGGNGANVAQLMGVLDQMYNGIQSYAPNGTFAEACEAFILSRGITQAEIDAIRSLMIENVLE